MHDLMDVHASHGHMTQPAHVRQLLPLAHLQPDRPSAVMLTVLMPRCFMDSMFTLYAWSTCTASALPALLAGIDEQMCGAC